VRCVDEFGVGLLLCLSRKGVWWSVERGAWLVVVCCCSGEGLGNMREA
jgi:hypothetical protein